MSARAMCPDWLWNGHQPRITSVFQPIIDLLDGHPIGQEVLSRGMGELTSPSELFARARAEGALWELERACLTAAVRKISQLPDAARSTRFFLNVGPEVLSDPRFDDGSTLALLAENGLAPRDVVLEITENGAFSNAEILQGLVHRHSGRGFGIALDDFGAGHSGLITLSHCAPHFIKLDRALVQDIHRNSYRQHLVKSLVAFASSVDATLIAEGVESWEELAVLLRLGIRYAQGYLVARPAPLPPLPTEDFERRRDAAVRAIDFRESEDDETVGSVVIRRTSMEAGSITTEEMERLFRRTPSVDHVVLIRDARPVGLVTRQHFYARTAGPFGYPLLQKKSAELTANSKPLVVEDRMAITTLARVAMQRPVEEIYDPVVVTDTQGRFLGTVTMKQLIGRATELEVLAATGANPLTHLPGNRMIERWIRQAFQGGDFSVIYGDLDHFKAYNDRYGFLQGDRMLRFTARILGEHLHTMPTGAQLGHVGGDDFVIVCPGEVSEKALETLCRRFDEEKSSLFDPMDWERGWFESVNRQGTNVKLPPVTLSLAVLDSRNPGMELHPSSLSTQAALLKKKVKQLSEEKRASTFLFGHHSGLS